MASLELDDCERIAAGLRAPWSVGPTVSSVCSPRPSRSLKPHILGLPSLVVGQDLAQVIVDDLL
jgi:hypothetical protein